MVAHYDQSHHLVISGDEARGGVTGHNVRYVLALSMTGVIAAFAAIATYLGFERLREMLSAALASDPAAVAQGLALYSAIVLLGAVAGVVLHWLWSLIAGRSGDASESFMRARVQIQFAVLCVIMALLYVSTYGVPQL